MLILETSLTMGNIYGPFVCLGFVKKGLELPCIIFTARNDQISAFYHYQRDITIVTVCVFVFEQDYINGCPWVLIKLTRNIAYDIKKKVLLIFGLYLVKHSE